MKEIIVDVKSFFADKIALKVIFTGLFIRIVISAVVPLGFDEAYYSLYADNLAWGFFDHPPLVAFTAGIGIYLTGTYTALSLRLGAIILFLFSSMLIYTISNRLYNSQSARLALILFHIIPYFVFGMGAFVIPDNALGFFWLLVLYSLLLIQQTEKKEYIILAGISTGFALLSKYHGVLLIGGIGILLFFYRNWKDLWKNSFLYIALWLTIFIFLPNILWNYENDWLSYAYQFGKSSDGLSVSFTKFLQGIFVQMGYLLPWNMILILMSVYFTLKFKNRNAYFLIPFVIIPVTVFTLIGATRQILPHWPMPGYLAGIVLLAGVMPEWKKKNLKLFLIPSIVITYIVAAVILLQVVTGILPLQKNADVTLDGQGWKQVVKELKKEELLNQKTFLFTYKWFTSGQLSFALENKFPVLVFNKKNPHGFSTWYNYKSFTGKTGIFVCTERFNENPEDLFSDYFNEFELIKIIKTKRNGKTVQVFYIWKCGKLNKDFKTSY